MASDPQFLASLRLRHLAEDVRTADFKCNPAIDWYLENVALDHHRRRISPAICWLDGDALAGYLTVSMHEVSVQEASQRQALGLAGLKRMENQADVRHFPALLIGMLGVDSKYRRRGLGGFMVQHAIGQARVSSRTVGCRLVVVDSDNTDEALGMYGRARFQRLETQKKNGQQVRMFYDLGSHTGGADAPTEA